MKKFLNIYLICLATITTPFYGMDHIKNLWNKGKEKIGDAIHTIRMHSNDDYADIVNQYNAMRVTLFENLNHKYRRSKATEISNDDILELKKQLEEKNKKSTLTENDFSSCLLRYDEIYKQLKNEENNIYFVDTIMPVLLAKHTFAKNDDGDENIHKLTRFGSYLMESRLTWARENIHLMRTLIYQFHYPLTINRKIDSWILNQLDKVELNQLPAASQKWTKQRYLQAILTPHNTWLKHTKNDLINTLCFFIIGLKKLNEEHPNTPTYKLPKVIIFDCILRELIKSSIAKEAHETYNRILNNIKEDTQHIKHIEKKLFNGKQYKITPFLENNFESWAQKTIAPEAFLYNEIVKKKK